MLLQSYCLGSDSGPGHRQSATLRDSIRTEEHLPARMFLLACRTQRIETRRRENSARQLGYIMKQKEPNTILPTLRRLYGRCRKVRWTILIVLLTNATAVVLNMQIDDFRDRLGEEVNEMVAGRTEPPQEFPQFPWPPPRSSAIDNLPKDLFRDARNFQQISSILTRALTSVGYHEYVYFTIPGGFAIVTRIEQIDENRQPRAPPDRWSIRKIHLLSRPFTIQMYLKALFFENSGYFRIFVFTVSPYPFRQLGSYQSNSAQNGRKFKTV